MFFELQPFRAMDQVPCTLDVSTGRFAYVTQASLFRYAVQVHGDAEPVMQDMEKMPRALLFVNNLLLVSASGNFLYVVNLRTKHIQRHENILPNELVGISRFSYNPPRKCILVHGRDGSWFCLEGQWSIHDSVVFQTCPSTS